MILHTFQNIVQERLTKTEASLLNKGKEYNTDLDVLEFFKLAAKIDLLEKTPEEAWLGMFKKHIVYVFKLVHENEEIEEEKLESLIDEKIGDSINYLILFEALLKEKIFKRDTRKP